MITETDLREEMAKVADAAERTLVAASDLSAMAGRMQPVNSSQSVVSLSGGGIVAIVVGLVSIFACLIAVGFMIVTRADYASNQREVESMRREVQQLRDKVDVHDVYINTSFRKPKEQQ